MALFSKKASPVKKAVSNHNQSVEHEDSGFGTESGDLSPDMTQKATGTEVANGAKSSPKRMGKLLNMMKKY